MSGSCRSMPRKKTAPSDIVYLSIMSLRSLVNRFDLFETVINHQPQLLADAHHLVRARRGAADSQNGITLLKQPHGDRVEDFVERIVAEPFRSGKLSEWQCKPLPQYGYMSGSENWKRIRFHRANIVGNQRGIVSRSGPVRSGNQDHLRHTAKHSIARFVGCRTLASSSIRSEA